MSENTYKARLFAPAVKARCLNKKGPGFYSRTSLFLNYNIGVNLAKEYIETINFG